MKHFFSDYQHIWREFEEVDRAALALMNTDDLQLPMEYDRRINALLRAGGKSPGDDVWAAVLEDSESRRS